MENILKKRYSNGANSSHSKGGNLFAKNSNVVNGIFVLLINICGEITPSSGGQQLAAI